MRHVGPFEGRPNAPNVSAPERVFLELLSEVGVRQPLAEGAPEAGETSFSKIRPPFTYLFSLKHTRGVGLSVRAGATILRRSSSLGMTALWLAA